MDVIELGGAREAQYERFLLSRPGSLLYASLKYRDFLKALLGCRDEYLLAVEGGAVRGVLPLMVATSGGRRVYNSLPYYGSNGGAVADCPEAAAALVAEYNRRTAAPGVVAATVVDSPFEPPAAGYARTTGDWRLAQWTDLRPDDGDREHLLARVDPSARRNVRKALAAGVRVETGGAEMPRLREIHRRNMAAVGGRCKSDRFFECAPRYFDEGRDWELYVARHGGAVIAGLLLFYYHRTVEYFTPAAEEAHRPLQGLPLLVATAMAAAAARGLTRWNWGGTWITQEGVYRFKKKWATSEARYRYHTRVNDPDLLRQTPRRLLEDFPDFFVLPFGDLAKEAV
jgi:hypothetical protein